MTISLSLRFDVLNRDAFTCRYCGRHAPETELEVDHIQPRSEEGTDDLANLVTTCRDCNRGKGGKTISPPGYWTSLAGKFFCNWCVGGKARLQGYILTALRPDVFVVKHFSWTSGTLVWGTQLVMLEQIIREKWRLYETSEEMEDHYSYGGIAHQVGDVCKCQDQEEDAKNGPEPNDEICRICMVPNHSHFEIICHKCRSEEMEH